MEILINLLKQEFLDKNKYEKIFNILNFINFIDNFNFDLFTYLFMDIKPIDLIRL